MRDTPRLHVDDLLEAGSLLTLDDDRRHYLLHVMRASAGASVRVFNGRDGEWTARIGETARGRLSIVVESCRRSPASAPAGPTLLFAPLKRDATDLVVRMATELGAQLIAPVSTDRTIAGRVNLDRLRAIAREAAEQCERLDVPLIEAPVALGSLLDAWPADRPIAAAGARAPARRGGPGGAGAAAAGGLGGARPPTPGGRRRGSGPRTPRRCG